MTVRPELLAPAYTAFGLLLVSAVVAGSRILLTARRTRRDPAPGPGAAPLAPTGRDGCRAGDAAPDGSRSLDN